jgi:hypothetical protein
MYKISIDHELKLIKYSHSGLIKRETVGDVWRELLKMDEFTTQQYNLLTDYTKGEFDFSIDETDIVWSFFNSIAHILKNKKQAVITNTPFSTSIALLFEYEAYEKIEFHVKVFTTETAALNWILQKE